MASLAGGVALVPAVVLVVLGAAGVGVPWHLGTSLLVFCGLVFVLLIKFAAQIHWRAEATREAIRVECDLRLRYRGANRAAIVAGTILVSLLALYLVGERVGPR